MRSCMAKETWDEEKGSDERLLKLNFCEMLKTASVNCKLILVKDVGGDFPQAVWKPSWLATTALFTDRQPARHCPILIA